MDKGRIIDALLERLHEELSVLRAAAAAAREGATHEDAKPENEYDTRALEQSYLAGAQAARVEVLQASVDVVERSSDAPQPPGASISVGVAVIVDDGEGERRYYLCEVAGGTKLEVDGESWFVLTPSSPLGRKLIGRRVGDVIEHEVRGELRELEISAIA